MIHESPWGTFEVLLDEPNYKVKRIVVFPRQRFSLQYHNHREEHWTVVSGNGKILIRNKIKEAGVGSLWVIPKRAFHRATASDEELIFIETQLGDCYEEDIVRLEDDYGR